jgi:putative acyl-CoA dehydrogenase
LADVATIEPRARRVAERIVLALQGSLLVRFGKPAIADAFCASRLGRDWGGAFGTLPSGLELGPIIERAIPEPAGARGEFATGQQRA